MCAVLLLLVLLFSLIKKLVEAQEGEKQEQFYWT